MKTHLGIKKDGYTVYLCNQAIIANPEKLGKSGEELTCKNCVAIVEKCHRRKSELKKEYGNVVIGVTK